jgi:predicted tellurium resistance membrane protein TerC
MNPVEFFKRWKQGMDNLTPKQQSQAKLVGIRGSIIGLGLAWIVMLTRGMWYFSVVMFFAIWLQVIALIGAKQQHKVLLKLEESQTVNSFTEMGIDEEKLFGGN